MATLPLALLIGCFAPSAAAGPAPDPPPPIPAARRAALEFGVGLGVGQIADQGVWSVRPWIGVAGFGLDLSLQAPLRVGLADHRLRARDWDEVADLGRVLRFVRVGQAVTAGRLVDVTLGHGTLVRRYHNGVDDDHARLGLAVALPPDQTGWPVGLDAFVDQVLGAPVAGARAYTHFMAEQVEFGGTLALDTHRPRRLSDGADDAGWPHATYGVLPAAGLDLSLRPWQAEAWALTLVTDLNLVQTCLGWHGGARGEWTLPDGWHLALGGELILAGPGYDWAVFDTGWLVDRWRWAQAPGRLDAGAVGGRLLFSARFADRLTWGLEYADANAARRLDLSTWLHVPLSVVDLRGLWRQRGARSGLARPEDALAALSALAPLGPFWRVGGHLARVWRVPLGGDQYQPFTEAMLVLEAAAGR